MHWNMQPYDLESAVAMERQSFDLVSDNKTLYDYLGSN